MNKMLILLFTVLLSCVSHSAPNDIILQIEGWDQESMTITGWFADSDTLSKLLEQQSETINLKAATAAALQYLTTEFPKLQPDEPLMSPLSAEKILGWDFKELVVRQLDEGRSRASLISWTPKIGRSVYLELKFTPRFEGRSAQVDKRVVLLPNLQVVPMQKIPANAEERRQIEWWEAHMDYYNSGSKEEVLQRFTR